MRNASEERERKCVRIEREGGKEGVRERMVVLKEGMRIGDAWTD